MIKVTSRHILGLMGSFTVATPSSAHHINIHFENGESFYTSPVVYLTGVDGQNPRVAMKEGEPTTGGVDANENDFTEFTFVSFNIRGKINLDGLKIVPISREEDPFCKQLDLSLKSSPEGNKILLPSTFPKLTTSTICHFKIVSLDNEKNNVTEVYSVKFSSFASAPPVVGNPFFIATFGFCPSLPVR